MPRFTSPDCTRIDCLNLAAHPVHISAARQSRTPEAEGSAPEGDFSISDTTISELNALSTEDLEKLTTRIVQDRLRAKVEQEVLNNDTAATGHSIRNTVGIRIVHFLDPEGVATAVKLKSKFDLSREDKDWHHYLRVDGWITGKETDKSYGNVEGVIELLEALGGLAGAYEKTKESGPEGRLRVGLDVFEGIVSAELMEYKICFADKEYEYGKSDSLEFKSLRTFLSEAVDKHLEPKAITGEEKKTAEASNQSD
ncbi:hypothetical protein MNV49_001145 [Pseudohyphozyma bogoriensis]|nr:hypothetical protein MNV49_001145 [Pseudohyphozyma bogoriensis]